MKTSGELRAAAVRCRRLADGLGNPEDALNLKTLATEYEAEADAAEARNAASLAMKKQ
jgi:hypothetical protein